MSLEEWGWNEETAEELKNFGLQPGRIIGQGKDIYTMAVETGTSIGRVSGAFGYRAAIASDYPVVGDFVGYHGEDGQGIIERVLPRMGVLSRQSSGKEIEEQILASNIDTVFLIYGLDGGRGYNVHLLERMLTLVAGSGARPVVVLNKSDLCEDAEVILTEAQKAAPGAKIILSSIITGEGISDIKACLVKEKTHFFFGKSGVGKSSLINAAAGYDMRKTTSIREQDGKGRHTTTSRDLVRLPEGALLIDSPGLREFALWSDQESLDAVFPEIAEFASACRFRDCGHISEPECGVRDALAAGALSEERYESFLSYRKEIRYIKSKSDENIRNEEHKKWKGIAKLQKTFKKEKRF
jgi:ribosome biogenesis GTPase / thiamine phosphate phosphatase